MGHLTAQSAIYGIWALWAFSWIVAAMWSGQTVNRPGTTWRSIYRIPEVLGFVLLLGFYGRFNRGTGELDEFRGMTVLWHAPPAVSLWMIVLCSTGFLFAWWARLHLGRLWSGAVTRKEGHRVIDTGPYRLVRHPIYTGILIAALTTVVARGTEQALAGFVLLLVGFWIKARLEENFLRKELGADAYDAYARKTPMLIPFVA